MTKTILNAALAMLLTAGVASAVSLSLVPSDPVLNLGGTVFVDLVVDDLGSFAAPSLGAWIIDITYDSSIFSITNPDVTFGTFLGDAGLFEVIENVDASTPGLVLLDQTSLLPDIALTSLQPASFTLATLGFSAIDVGVGVFGFATTDLSDEAAVSLSVTAATPGSAQVVPEPSGLTLLGLGVAALAWLKRRRLWRRYAPSGASRA